MNLRSLLVALSLLLATSFVASAQLITHHQELTGYADIITANLECSNQESEWREVAPSLLLSSHITSTVWFDNGKVRIVGKLVDGKQDGEWREFSRAPFMHLIYNFEDGKLIGSYVCHSGESYIYAYFVNNRIVGEFSLESSNSLSIKGACNDKGLATGEWLLSDNSPIQRRYTFEDGVAIKIEEFDVQRGETVVLRDLSAYETKLWSGPNDIPFSLGECGDYDGVSDYLLKKMPLYRYLVEFGCTPFAVVASSKVIDDEVIAGDPNDADHIVISKESMTLKLFDSKGGLIYCFPVAVGKNYGNKHQVGDMKTPEGEFTVQQIQDASTWGHDFKDGKGRIEGAYGNWFIRLKTPPHTGIGIHGTHDPSSIGTRATEGCIRLHNENLDKLKKLVKVGMKVIILTSELDQAAGKSLNE